MDIDLTAEEERRLDALVAAGRYPSRAAAVRAALGLLDREEAAFEAERARLNALIDEGLASAERGDFVSPEEARRRIEEHMEKALAARAKAEADVPE
jgi:putative addiction module CopG family antidote